MRHLFALIALLALAPPAAAGVVDDRGRPLDGLPASPRIAALAPHLAELVFAAGAGERLVATVEYSDFPAEAATVPRFGDAFRVDLERLVAAAPDLVLAWAGGTPPGLVGQLEQQGFRVAVLRSATLDDVSRQLRLIGALAGTDAAAAEAAAAYDARLQRLRERHEDLAAVVVFYQISARPLYTVGGGHIISDAIELCGGRNAFASLQTLAPTVGIEAVLAAEPEVMLAGAHDGKPDPGELSQWTRWRRIPAVRDGHLYQLDATLMGRPTPRMLDGIAAMCERIARAR